MFRWTLGSSLILLIAAGSLATSWTPAQAATVKCTNRTLTEQDERRLMPVAKAVLPEDASFEGTPEICRNPGTATATFQTERVQKTDGLEEWWRIECERGQVNWRCEKPILERRAVFTRSIDGQQRRVHLAFPEIIPLPTARELTIRAFNIFEERRALTKQCTPGPAHEDPQETWNNMRVRYLLQPSDVDLNVSIRALADTTRIRFFKDRGLEFNFNHGGQDLSSVSAECWNEWGTVG